jgi:hypothetical protein
MTAAQIEALPLHVKVRLFPHHPISRWYMGTDDDDF